MASKEDKVSTDNNNMPNEPIVPESVRAHPAWFRLIDQRNWYDRKSQHCQRWYKRLKIAQVTLAVLVPATSLLPSDCAKWAASIAGILIAVLEAAQQMNQYSTLWVTHRATAERLKHEQYLFLSSAGPYKGLAEADRLLRAMDPMIGPVIECAWRREVQSRALAALRDALLPRLVSGELRIRDAEGLLERTPC